MDEDDTGPEYTELTRLDSSLPSSSTAADALAAAQWHGEYQYDDSSFLAYSRRQAQQEDRTNSRCSSVTQYSATDTESSAVSSVWMDYDLLRQDWNEQPCSSTHLQHLPAGVPSSAISEESERWWESAWNTANAERLECPTPQSQDSWATPRRLDGLRTPETLEELERYVDLDESELDRRLSELERTIENDREIRAERLADDRVDVEGVDGRGASVEREEPDIAQIVEQLRALEKRIRKDLRGMRAKAERDKAKHRFHDEGMALLSSALGDSHPMLQTFCNILATKFQMKDSNKNCPSRQRDECLRLPREYGLQYRKSRWLLCGREIGELGQCTRTAVVYYSRARTGFARVLPDMSPSAPRSWRYEADRKRTSADPSPSPHRIRKSSREPVREREEVLECDRCEETFHTRAELESHAASHVAMEDEVEEREEGEEEEEERVTCEDCQHVFPTDPTEQQQQQHYFLRDQCACECGHSGELTACERREHANGCEQAPPEWTAREERCAGSVSSSGDQNEEEADGKAASSSVRKKRRKCYDRVNCPGCGLNINQGSLRRHMKRVGCVDPDGGAKERKSRSPRKGKVAMPVVKRDSADEDSQRKKRSRHFVDCPQCGKQIQQHNLQRHIGGARCVSKEEEAEKREERGRSKDWNYDRVNCPGCNMEMMRGNLRRHMKRSGCVGDLPDVNVREHSRTRCPHCATEVHKSALQVHVAKTGCDGQKAGSSNSEQVERRDVSHSWEYELVKCPQCALEMIRSSLLRHMRRTGCVHPQGGKTGRRQRSLQGRDGDSATVEQGRRRSTRRRTVARRVEEEDGDSTQDDWDGEEMEADYHSTEDEATTDCGPEENEEMEEEETTAVVVVSGHVVVREDEMETKQAKATSLDEGDEEEGDTGMEVEEEMRVEGSVNQEKADVSCGEEVEDDAPIEDDDDREGEGEDVGCSVLEEEAVDADESLKELSSVFDELSDSEKGEEEEVVQSKNHLSSLLNELDGWDGPRDQVADAAEQPANGEQKGDMSELAKMLEMSDSEDEENGETPRGEAEEDAADTSSFDAVVQDGVVEKQAVGEDTASSEDSTTRMAMEEEERNAVAERDLCGEEDQPPQLPTVDVAESVNPQEEQSGEESERVKEQLLPAEEEMEFGLEFEETTLDDWAIVDDAALLEEGGEEDEEESVDAMSPSDALAPSLFTPTTRSHPITSRIVELVEKNTVEMKTVEKKTVEEPPDPYPEEDDDGEEEEEEQTGPSRLIESSTTECVAAPRLEEDTSMASADPTLTTPASHRRKNPHPHKSPIFLRLEREREEKERREKEREEEEKEEEERNRRESASTTRSSTSDSDAASSVTSAPSFGEAAEGGKRRRLYRFRALPNGKFRRIRVARFEPVYPCRMVMSVDAVLAPISEGMIKMMTGCVQDTLTSLVKEVEDEEEKEEEDDATSLKFVCCTCDRSFSSSMLHGQHMRECRSQPGPSAKRSRVEEEGEERIENGVAESNQHKV